MRGFFITVLVCLHAYTGLSQNNDSAVIRRIVNETLTNGTAYENLRILCKQAGPRLSGSPQFSRAVNLVRGLMQQAGADTVYLQQCMIPHWVRGEKERGEIVLNDGQKYTLHLCALGTSVGTGTGGVSAPVIEVNSMAELNAIGKAVKGRIVFFNFPMNPAYINTFRAYAESGVSRTAGPAMAGKYGAVGVIVRSLAINLNDYPHTGVTVYNDSFPKIPAVAISTNDAEFLSGELKKQNVARGYFRTTCKKLPDVVGYNVVGEIKGAAISEEIVTVGGHLDSWDLAEGANDDGSGVVQAIEVLRTFKKSGVRPKRTLRAVAFANEEISGTGAKAYLREAKAKNERHVFALESDGGGFTPRGFGLDMDAEKRDKVLTWAKLFRPYGLVEIEDGPSGADVEPLKEIGAALAGLDADSQRYFDIHHAATDVFENVSRRELHLGAAAMAIFIYLVSEHGL